MELVIQLYRLVNIRNPEFPSGSGQGAPKLVPLGMEIFPKNLPLSESIVPAARLASQLK